MTLERLILIRAYCGDHDALTELLIRQWFRDRGLVDPISLEALLTFPPYTP